MQTAALVLAPLAFAGFLVALSCVVTWMREEEVERVAAMEAEHGFSLRF